MPLLEYTCSLGHVTEKLVTKIDKAPNSIKCRTCKKIAKALDFPTSTSFRLKPGGVGGFYRPHEE